MVDGCLTEQPADSGQCDFSIQSQHGGLMVIILYAIDCNSPSHFFAVH